MPNCRCANAKASWRVETSKLAWQCTDSGQLLLYSCSMCMTQTCGRRACFGHAFRRPICSAVLHIVYLHDCQVTGPFQEAPTLNAWHVNWGDVAHTHT